jgi:hypothetical protein
MPNAARVASMLRWIGTDSRSFALGATTNCCSTCGHAAPISTLDRMSSTVAIAGSCRLRRNTAAKNGRRADDRDEEQDQLGGHHRVEVGVRGAVEDVLATVGEQQLVPVEVVRHGLEQHEHARQHGELGAGGAR